MNILSSASFIDYGGSGLLAQTNPVEIINPTIRQVTNGVSTYLPSILGAVAILIVGWLAAVIVASIVGGLLRKTDFDNRLATWLGGGRGIDRSIPIEKWFSTAIFWLVFLFAIDAFLNALQLPAVSAPLNSFLQQIFSYLPRIVSAAVTLGIAWLLATLAKKIVVRGVGSFNLENRIAQTTGAAPEDTPLALNEAFGNALYWFILLFFLPLVLDILQLQGPLQPVQNLLNQILLAIPKILTAALIGVIGWFIARIVRIIVTNFLSAVGTDQIGSKVGLRQGRNTLALSQILGTLVYVLILIPTAIAALNALQIEAISAPAVGMLGQILNSLPKIFTAALILTVSYAIGRFVSDLVTNILTSIGFDDIFSWLGIPREPPKTSEYVGAGGGSSKVIQQTPSQIAGIIVLVGIMLTGAVAAVEKLEFAALTRIVNAVLEVSVNVLGGLIVLAIGLYLANLAYNVISRSGAGQVKILAQTARIAIIAFSAAMALDRMGVASNIVNLAFGLLLGGIAVAIALAFGLGGRSVADEVLREWLASWKQRK
ncbi:MAG: mechanosensitive ion channel [Cyanobacteriota bacterium ELA615]